MMEPGDSKIEREIWLQTRNGFPPKIQYSASISSSPSNQYPREISIKPSVQRHATLTFVDDIHPTNQRMHSVKSVTKVVKTGDIKTVHTYANDADSSFSGLPREYSGVDIRNQNSPFLMTVPNAGQLRSAFSAFEGLDRIGATPNGRDSSLDMKNSRDRSHSKHSASISTLPLSGSSQRTSSRKYSESGGSQFERLKAGLTKKHQYIQEIRSGKRIGFYRFIVDIGRGNFSRVKLAVHTLVHEQVAVKVIDRTKFDEKTRRLLSQEVQNMERLNHPCIIRLFEVNENVQRWHLIMEHAPGGELHNFLRRNGRMEEKSAKQIAAQIVSALAYMHKMKVMHRDLKAENIFFSAPGCIKLGDFGFSKLCAPNAALTTFCGSPPYAAPELFVADSYCGTSVDLWALGVLIYYITAGQLPFRADAFSKLKRLILAADYPKPAFFSTQLSSLIGGLLKPNVEARMDMLQVQQHTWFQDVSWSDLATKGVASIGQLSDRTAREMLLKWWGVDDVELDGALKDGPKNPLTGVYRILRNQGARHLKTVTLSASTDRVQSIEVRPRTTLLHKSRAALTRAGGELTAVDLRDKKNVKGKLDTQTRVCSIV